MGKTLVSSSLIDRVAASINAKVIEVPVGFKWFVDPLFSGEVAFGGEESSGMSFLRKDGRVWTTDKDGLIPDLLAAEITAKTGKNPAQLHQEQVDRFGESWYKRVDTPTTLEQKQKFAKLPATTSRPPSWPARTSPPSSPKPRANQRQDRRPEGHHREQLVRGPSFRHREHLQGVRRVLRIPRSPRQGARRSHRSRGQGLGRVIIGESA